MTVLYNFRNTHTGAKPYACDLCTFNSGDRSTISKHKKNVHKKTTLDEYKYF